MVNFPRMSSPRKMVVLCDFPLMDLATFLIVSPYVLAPKPEAAASLAFFTATPKLVSRKGNLPSLGSSRPFLVELGGPRNPRKTWDLHFREDILAALTWKVI